MLDKNIINNLKQEYDDMTKCENILRSLGLNPVNISFDHICEKISNIIMQDIFKTLVSEIEKLETEQDKLIITLTVEQLYSKYGDLKEKKINEEN